MYNRFKSYYPISLLAALLVYFVYRSAGAPFSDFAGYYFGSKELLTGNFQNVYDTYALNALIAGQGYTGVFVSYTPFPPFTSIVFAPFLLFPVAVSKIIFNTFSVLLFLCTIIRVRRFFALPQWLIWVIPVVFVIPLRNNIFFGQSYLLLCALMLEGYMAYKKGRVVLSCFIWAITIVFKIFPLVILFYLMAKKQYKHVLYCTAACMLLGAVSLAVNGYSSWQYYVFTILPRATSGELNDSYTTIFQSAFMLMKNLFVYDEVQNANVLYNSPVVFIIGMALFKAGLLACCVGITLQKKIHDFVAFSVWITASLLLSPNGSSYSLILLLIPFLAITFAKAPEENNNFRVYISIVVLLLICSIPVQLFAGLPLWWQFPRLYLLLLFFVLLTGFMKPEFPYKLFAAFLVLLIITDVRKLFSNRDNSTVRSGYLLASNAPLIYQYALKNNRLVYYYYNETGRHEAVTSFAVRGYTMHEVQIQNNQLFYKGRQLTASPDLKKQPLLVNGKDIVYLSDQNRGVGFYALRRIKLE